MSALTAAREATMMMRLGRCAAVGLVMALGACDDESTGTSDTSDTSVAEVVSALTISAQFDSAAPKTGQNHLLITVLDGAGGGVEGATLTVVPTMPMMGHGSTETPVISELGDGVYDAFPVTFQMPGMWKIEIDAELGDVNADLDFDVTVQ